MGDLSFKQYLLDHHIEEASELYMDALEFETMLSNSSQSVNQEAVPADMMQFFSDAQWDELLFEFQPSMNAYTSKYDVPAIHRQFKNGEKPVNVVPGPLQHYLIASNAEESWVRSMGKVEYQALSRAQNREPFNQIAKSLWPNFAASKSHEMLTEIILQWLDQALIVDAGVPIPQDAEFESLD